MYIGYISSSEDDLQAHPARRLILVRGTCPTSSQKKKLKAKIRAIYSEIPIFGCTIRKSSIHGKPYTLVSSELKISVVERMMNFIAASVVIFCIPVVHAMTLIFLVFF